MSGLMEKDIRLILQRKKFMLMLMAMAICLSFAMDDSFITSYMAMIGMVFALTTLSYDEYDNGLPFIFTLPISRRDYAFEKQIFG